MLWTSMIEASVTLDDNIRLGKIEINVFDATAQQSIKYNITPQGSF